MNAVGRDGLATDRREPRRLGSLSRGTLVQADGGSDGLRKALSADGVTSDKRDYRKF